MTQSLCYHLQLLPLTSRQQLLYIKQLFCFLIAAGNVLLTEDGTVKLGKMWLYIRPTYGLRWCIS